jgi:DNA-binding SARP family transcriptional activator
VVRRPAAAPVGGDGANLEIRLLGGATVRVQGEVLELRSRRVRSLLAFLVLNADVAHDRRRLAFAFWPDSSEGQALTNLRNLLHTLRQAHPSIDASLRVTATTLRWAPTLPTRVDVEEFVDAAHAATTADPDDADDLIARCRAAVALYGGDLLAGDHDEWILTRRDALRDQYREVLRLLATALIDSGEPGDALAVTRELVRADPLDESAHRLRIEAHHAAGDRAGAVRAYHECVATLERELGVEPAQATVDMYAALVESPGAEGATRRESRVRTRVDLVGRDVEWQRLLAAWHTAEHGPPGVVFVTGEPGIGKTRLVNELRAWCARSAVTVAEARSYATEGNLAYGVVVSWLRSPDIRAGLSRLQHDQRADLGRMLPEIGSPAPADGSDDAERRRRIFDAAVAAITSSGQPTLLVADDSQWSDQVSLEFIHYLVRQDVRVPLLVVLTARREELDAGHPLTALRDSLASLERATELRLERLSREATGELGCRLTGSQLDAGQVEALFAETEGNPLFVVETLRSGGDRGADASALSPRLRAVIDARFHRLSGVAAAVLSVAAVAARPCSTSLLARLCDLDDRSLARGLDELWQRGILVETGTDSYAFSHGKLRDVAYENLSPIVRRSHHAAVAAVLADLAGDDPGVASSEVAAHFEAANRPDEAIVWLRKAALEAQKVAAYVEAVRLIDRALALVSSLPGAIRHMRELELLATMPPALGGAEGYDTARMHEAHRLATDVAARLGVELDPSVLRSMVMAALCRDEFDRAADAARELLSRADATGDASLCMESHYLLGISAFWAAHLEEAREHFEHVVTDFDPASRARHHEVYGHDPQVVCLSRLANTLWFLGREDDARRTCDDALALADEVGHAFSRDTAAIFSCVLAIDMGDHDALRRRVAQLGAFGLDTLPFITKHEAMAGLLDVLDGNQAEGIARTRAALDRCGGRNFYPGFRATIMRALLAAHLVAGDATGGLVTCERMLSLRSTPLWVPEAHRTKAELLHLNGAATHQIGRELAAAEEVARRQGAGGHLRRIENTRRDVGRTASSATP